VLAPEVVPERLAFDLDGVALPLSLPAASLFWAMW
jgi:hypothetical protein